MASKWAKIKDKFPKLGASDDQGFIEKVAEARMTHGALTLKELMAKYAEIRAQKDELEDQISCLNVDIEALNQLLLEQLEAAGLTSMKAEDGKNFFMNVEPTVKVIDRGLLEAHIEAHPELEYLYGIMWQSLNSLVKEKLEKGEDDSIPPGTEVYIKTNIRMRKA